MCLSLQYPVSSLTINLIVLLILFRNLGKYSLMNFLACFCPGEPFHHSGALSVDHFAMVSATFLLVASHNDINPINGLGTLSLART